MKYLFKAYYNDGTYYEQNLEDKSVLEPDKKSCFYDIQHEKLIKFELNNQNQDKKYSINLTNGEILVKINENILRIPPPKEELENFRLIYFRRKEIGVNYFYKTEKGEISSEKILYYILGWQANNKFGENKQFTIEIE